MSEPRDTTTTDEAAAQVAEAEPKRKIELEVDIQDAGPCKKHLVISIPSAEVDRHFAETLKDMSKDAQVPGFRQGRAPRKLVEKRYRKEVSGQVKSVLLLACMEQLDSDYKLNPITQPNLDLETIKLIEGEPLRFELDVEVHPDFPLPDYKALSVKRPVKKISEADIDAQLLSFLERYAKIVPKTNAGAELGDFITADLSFHKDGVMFNEARELEFRLQPELRFQDGHIPDLSGSLLGCKPGDVRSAEAKIGMSSPDHALRGQTIEVTFRIKDLKQMRLPEVNQEFLNTIGFDTEAELREGLKGVLERRFAYLQQQSMRRQIVDQLIERTAFDLPAELVTRQERSTLRRQIEELRQSGLSDSQIRAREAEIRANAHERTLRGLKEFFLLSKIAEAEDVKVDEADIDAEIVALAARSNESARRIRARIEREGLAEGLAEQILERKTIERILEFITIEEVAMEEEKPVETLDKTASSVAEPPAEESE